VDERGDGLIDRLRVELAARERAVAEAHGDALGLDAGQLRRAQLRDHDTDRIRSGVDRSEPDGRHHRETLSCKRWR
jgi:hypothetical protein